jgi:uncharacterized protein
MIRLLLLALLFFLGYSLYDVIFRPLSGRGKPLPKEKTSQGEDMVRDPQCGVYIPRGDAIEKVVNGKKRFFCSRECLDAFLDQK